MWVRPGDADKIEGTRTHLQGEYRCRDVNRGQRSHRIREGDERRGKVSESN